MNGRPPNRPPQGPTFTQRDIYYVLFRHKWLVITLTLMGIVSSWAVYRFWRFPFISQAEIYIGYVQRPTRSPDELTSDSKLVSPDNQGADILNTEMAIMNSRDLAKDVARMMGPQRILGDSSNLEAAADFISAHLTNYVPKLCDVITLQFSANDPSLVQPVLSNVMVAYKAKYVQTHLSTGLQDNFLEEQTDNAKSKMEAARNALRDEKIRLGVASSEDAMKDQQELISKLRGSLYEEMANYAEISAQVTELGQRVSALASNATKTTATTSTSNLALGEAATPAQPPSDVVSKYQGLLTQLATRRASEQNLLNLFTTNNLQVQNAQHLRAGVETEIKQMEDQYPALASAKVSEPGRSGFPSAAPSAPSPAADPVQAYRDAYGKQRGLLARINQLSNSLASAESIVTNLDAGEDRIREREVEVTNAMATYQFFLQSSEQARINNESGPGRVSNIQVVEDSTPPGRDFKKIIKATGGVLALFLGLAFALPFAIEFFLDQSLKRPSDVQALGAPFFISLPKMTNGKVRALNPAKSDRLLSAPAGAKSEETPESKAAAVLNGDGHGHIAVWDQRHELRTHFETLRDRLMAYFEIINLTHKPKLVAVTSCGHGAGVTTTAAGLASCLSETGEGNVLLVNMNGPEGEAHHFYKGQMACGIEEALEKGKRSDAKVKDHLYVAKEDGDERLPRIMPKRFSHLVPMMKSSDFDYIIFDMPPVSEISITPRLARFMDMVLLVIESEKTPRDSATRAASILSESKTNVGLVLNKSRQYLPRMLRQEI